MHRWHLKYRSLTREELHDELVELCGRLRRGLRSEAGRRSRGSARTSRSARCVVMKEHADSDLAALLDADRRTYSLLAAVHDIAALMSRLEERGRAAAHGGSRFLS